MGMDIIVADWETYYAPDQGYTLSKMTTEEYVRDPRFETILVSFKINHEKPFWVPKPHVAAELRKMRFDRNALLAHHIHFDGLIMYHHYGISPRFMFDTLGMARHLHGSNARLSLEKLAERYGVGRKGTEVHNVKGLHYDDFDRAGLKRYGDYSCLDSDLERAIFDIMAPHFSREEFEIHDQVIRMFTEPEFRLDVEMLQRYAAAIRTEKVSLMLQAGVQQTDLMSNEKFAQVLRDMGIDPPMKISPTWLKKTEEEREELRAQGKNGTTYAFAKTDLGMQQLQEHPDERVQILVEARLKNKTTLAERGAERLVGMAGRGPATIYLKYSGASGTHRLSGGDKFNWQSMKRGSDLRNAVMAPEGYVCVVADSSTIEARLLDWLSGQDDMVEVYRKQDNKTGPDMYCVIGGRIYKRTITKEDDPDERQMGKVAKLGLGFGMGADKFIFAVRGQAKVNILDADGQPIIDKFEDGKPVYKKKPLVIDPAFAKEVVTIYREGHPQVRKLWRRGDAALKAITEGQVGLPVDFRGIVKTIKDGLELPGGIKIMYPDLKREKVGTGDSIYDYEYTFWNGKLREHIYGAKVIENIIQCLARITVFRQCLDTARETRGIARWKHSMHDEGIFIAPYFEAPWVLEVLMRNMRTPPEWAPTLPVNCEGGFNERYGKAKK